MEKLWLAPELTETEPDGEMEPPAPAEVVIVYVVCPDDGGGCVEEEPAAWVKLNEAPPILAVKFLDDEDVLAATVTFTAPLPVPLPPELIVIHGAPPDTVQVHPLCVVTYMFPVIPAALAE